MGLTVFKIIEEIKSTIRCKTMLREFAIRQNQLASAKSYQLQINKLQKRVSQFLRHHPELK